MKPQTIKKHLENYFNDNLNDGTRYVIITDSESKIPDQSKSSNNNITIINIGNEIFDANIFNVINLNELEREYTSLDVFFQSHIKR